MGLGFGVSEERSFLIIHSVLSFCLLLLVFSLVSCKKAKEERVLLEGEVSVQEVENALGKALQGATLEHLRAGQTATYEVNMRIESSEDVRLLSKIEYLIKPHPITSDEPIEPQFRKFLRMSTSWDYTVDPPRKEVLEKSISLPESTISLLGRSLESTLSFSSFHLTTSSTPIVRRTYHRLRTFTQLEGPPQSVRSRPDCGGLSPCQIRTTTVEYDEANWFSEKDYKILQYQYVISTDPPYLDDAVGLLVRACLGLYVDIDTRNVYVRECQILTDFQK